MENVKELAIGSPIGGGRPPVMDATGVTSRPFSLMAPRVQQPAPSRPWLKWAAAFFALLLAGGVAIEQQQRREREAQQELERQREIVARRERELRRQQGIIEAQARELQRQRIERQRLAGQQQQLEQRRQQQMLEARRTPLPTPSRPVVTYEQSLARAQEALRRGSPQAAQLAAQTIRMDPSKPGGYEVLGYSRLYFFDDPSGAETAMRAAMSRGGSAVFRVRHDHANGNFQQYCSGVLMIRPSGISFAAADNSDRFDGRTGEIQDANRNKLQRGGFHVRTSTRNYNFGPTGTQPDAEVALAVRLLGR